MNRNVSPKVVVSVLLAIIVPAVAFVVISNLRMDQRSEQARLAAEAVRQRQADYAASHPTTTEPEVHPTTTEPEVSEAETEDSEPEATDSSPRPPKSREESQELGRSFAAYLSDPDECADSYSTENLDDLGVDWSAFVAACQWEVMWNG